LREQRVDCFSPKELEAVPFFLGRQVGQRFGLGVGGKAAAGGFGQVIVELAVVVGSASVARALGIRSLGDFEDAPMGRRNEQKVQDGIRSARLVELGVVRAAMVVLAGRQSDEQEQYACEEGECELVHLSPRK